MSGVNCKGQNQPFSIAEVLSFNQEDNELLATPRESCNLSINSGLDLALQDHVFPRYFHIGLNHITFGRVFLSLSVSKQGMSSFIDILLALVFIKNSSR